MVKNLQIFLSLNSGIGKLYHFQGLTRTLLSLKFTVETMTKNYRVKKETYHL
ncbi:MAG: hypothetical protein ACI9K4_001373 [Polaribacter sp.]|jgi:hypothetical protein